LASAQIANRHSVAKEKAALARGLFIQVVENFSSDFFGPVVQVQILLDLSALVSVLKRFFWLVFQLTERVAGIPDDLGDGFHHFFHNAFPFVTELRSGSSLPCRWPDSQLPYTLRL
jgi:hypothetical protein